MSDLSCSALWRRCSFHQFITLITELIIIVDNRQMALHHVMLMALPTMSAGASDGLARLPMMGWNSWNWIGVSGCADGCASEGMSGR